MQQCQNCFPLIAIAILRLVLLFRFAVWKNVSKLVTHVADALVIPNLFTSLPSLPATPDPSIQVSHL